MFRYSPTLALSDVTLWASPQLRPVQAGAAACGLCVLHGRGSWRGRGAAESAVALLHGLPAVQEDPVGTGDRLPVPPGGPGEVGRGPRGDLHPVRPHV